MTTLVFGPYAMRCATANVEFYAQEIGVLTLVRLADGAGIKSSTYQYDEIKRDTPEIYRDASAGLRISGGTFPRNDGELENNAAQAKSRFEKAAELRNMLDDCAYDGRPGVSPRLLPNN